MANNSHELIIIGGGPAGLTAGLYAARARIRTLLVESAIAGGQITNSPLVENYPGFPQGISGFDLGQLFYEQATKYGLETITAEVTGVEAASERKLVHTSEGDYHARALILAMGAEHTRLGITGEERLLGKGVSFCATCDGAFFRDQPVAVVGGGDAALTEALFLSQLCSKVHVIHRRDQLRASRILQERVFANSNMEVIWDSVVEQIAGEDKVHHLCVRNLKSGELSELPVSGIFIAVGFRPNTAYLRGVVRLNDAGGIIVNDLMETGTPGVFAAGDVRHNASRQVITAAGDGATAALSAEKFLRTG